MFYHATVGLCFFIFFFSIVARYHLATPHPGKHAYVRHDGEFAGQSYHLINSGTTALVGLGGFCQMNSLVCFSPTPVLLVGN